MADPGAKITIELQAITDAANAKLNSFFSSLSGQMKAANVTAASAAAQVPAAWAAAFGKAAQQTNTHIAGMSYYFRSAIDAIRVAAMGGGARAGFYAIDEAVRGLLASGLSLSVLLPILAGLAAAVGSGVLVWREWTSAEREAEKAAKDLHDKIKDTIELLKQMQDLQKAGLLSPEAVQRNRDILSGKIKVFQNPASTGIGGVQDMIEQAANLPPPTHHVPEQFIGGGQFVPGQMIPAHDEPFKEITGDALAKYVQNKVAVPGGIDPEQEKAAAHFRELSEQIHAKSISDLDAEVQKIHEKYERERAEIADTATVAGKVVSPADQQKAIEESKGNERIEIERKVQEQQTKVNEEYARGREEFARRANEKLDKDLEESAAAQGKTRQEIYQEEYEKRIVLLQLLKLTGILTEQQYTDAVKAEQAKRLRGEQAELEIRKRIAAIKEQGGQKDYDFQRRQIEQNPFLTKDEKDDAVRDINAKQQAEVTAALQANQSALAKENNEEKVVGLKQEEARLQQQLNGLLLEQQKLQNDEGLINNLKSAWVEFYNKVADTSKDLANTLVSPFEGMREGLDKAFNDLLLKGSNAKQFFGNVAIGILSSMRKAFSEMVADWATKQVMMLVKSIATQAAITLGFAGETAARTGIHAGGEAAQTGATGVGAVARGAIRLGETIFHGFLVALRVGAHIAGEILMTGVTLVNTLLRRTAAFLEAQPYIFLAAVKAASAVADIPYVGPILAPIAAATTFALLEAMAVFKEGGYTGDGSASEVAGLVHRGEFVIPAERVRQFGGGFFESIRNGSFSPGSPVSSLAGRPSSHSEGGVSVNHKTEMHLAVVDSEESARRVLQSEEGEKFWLSMADKHIYKFQR